MEREDFVRLLTPLVLAMRAEFDAPTWGAYHAALKDVPEPLVVLAIEATIREPREFFPKAGELRAICERQRRLIVAANPWEPCSECEDHPRFQEVLIDGVARMQKCPCLEWYRRRLDTLGAMEPVAMLEGEAAAQAEQHYPTMAQLPSDVRTRLEAVAARKSLTSSTR